MTELSGPLAAGAVVQELRFFRGRCQKLSDSGVAARALRRALMTLEGQVLSRLQELQRLGADLDYGDGLGTALIETVHMRSEVFATTLLRLGASPSVTDYSGMSPLLLATIQGDHAMMALLLAHGASPCQRDPQRCTPLEHAVQARDARATQMLLAYDACLDDADLADRGFADDVFELGIARPWRSGQGPFPMEYLRLVRPWMLLSLRRATVHLTLKPWLGDTREARRASRSAPASDACYLLVFSLPRSLVSRTLGFLTGRDLRFPSLLKLRDSFEDTWREVLRRSAEADDVASRSGAPQLSSRPLDELASCA